MKIEADTALRPCVVTFGEGTAREERHSALFHFWGMKQHPQPALLVGETAGQVSFPIGVVEYGDGTVHEVRPQRIRFTDGMRERFCWEGDGDVDALA